MVDANEKIEPLFACQANEFCGTECSYPTDMLRMFDGKPWCEGCYDDLPSNEQQPLPDGEEDETTAWFELPAFVSPDKARIERLEAQLAERDKFIVSKGLWNEFVDQLPAALESKS